MDDSRLRELELRNQVHLSMQRRRVSEAVAEAKAIVAVGSAVALCLALAVAAVAAPLVLSLRSGRSHPSACPQEPTPERRP